MEERLQYLTEAEVAGKPVEVGFIPASCTKKLARGVFVYLGYVVRDGKIVPNICIFDRGLKLDPIGGNTSCYDLSRSMGGVICIRGMVLDRFGKPTKYMIEVYTPLTQPPHSKETVVPVSPVQQQRKPRPVLRVVK